DIITIYKGIIWAVDNGAQVINMSFSTPVQTNLMQKAITYAQAHGVILVAAAGNSNAPLLPWPAGFSGVISTAATDLSDVKASFSNYWTGMVMDAPGVNLILAAPGNLYGCMSGTSFSTPLVTAAVADVLSVVPGGGTSGTQQLRSGGVNIDANNPSYGGQLGVRVDVLKSVHPN